MSDTVTARVAKVLPGVFDGALVPDNFAGGADVYFVELMKQVGITA